MSDSGGRRARLGRYALWQLRDYVFERGLPTLIVAALVLFPLVQVMRGVRRGGAPPENVREVAARMFAEMFTGILGFVIVMLSANGVVANDRKNGYYRFLFAKPLSIARYYTQSFALGAVGAVATAAVVQGAFALLVHPAWSTGALAYVALYYVALGGIVFLFSTLSRLDWVLGAGLWGVAQLLRSLYPADGGAAGRVLNVVLPPTHSLAAVGRVLFGREPLGLHPGDRAFLLAVAWLLAWGIGGFVAGLLVLRRRSMAQ